MFGRLEEQNTFQNIRIKSRHRLSSQVSKEATKRGQLSLSSGWGTFGSNADAQEQRRAEKQNAVESDVF